jgi:hypothetical protein
MVHDRRRLIREHKQSRQMAVHNFRFPALSSHNSLIAVCPGNACQKETLGPSLQLHTAHEVEFTRPSKFRLRATMAQESQRKNKGRVAAALFVV